MNFFLMVFTVVVASGIINVKGVLSDQMLKLIFYVCCLMCYAWAYLNGRSLSGVRYPRWPLAILLLAMLVACCSATVFHPQPITTSIMAALPMILPYTLFWVWMKLEIPEEKIIKMMIILCAISVPVYFCNVLTFPNYLFGEATDAYEDLSRGALRVPVYFLEFFVLLMLYSVNRIVDGIKAKWVAIIAVCVFMIVISVIRQQIFFSALVALLLYLKNASWRKRIVVTVGVATVIFVVLPAIPIYKAMMELSENQALENESKDDIRITAMESYVDDFQTNGITRIIGNGVPSAGNSQWGNQYESLAESSLCFYVDVGWAGFYWLFGLVAVAALFWLLMDAVVKKKLFLDSYLTYWFIYIILLGIASGPILYRQQILYITIALYLVYREQGKNVKLHEKDSGYNFELQHIGGLAKLRRQRRKV